MKIKFNPLDKIVIFLKIMTPILITQGAMFAMSFFDTIMSGQSSPYDLAGVAIGSSIWLPVFTGLGGIFMAITPIVSQLLGANRKEMVPVQVVQGVYLALLISLLVIILGGLSLPWVMSLMSLEASVERIARGYLNALAFGVPALFVYYVLRAYIDALGQTNVTMFITLVSLPINIFFNYVFIFGRLGFPVLGGVGAGVATSITYWCLFLLAWYMVSKHKSFVNFGSSFSFSKVSLTTWKEQLIIGIPIAFAIFFETSIFAVVTLLISRFDTYTIAAHQAAMNFATMLYMVPLSISMALTILVGYEIGAKRPKDAKEYTYLGMAISLGLAVLCAAILLIFREQVAGLYSSDIGVISLTMEFLLLALFFQISDAFAAPIQGILRGYKDVNFTFIMALVSYWIIGLPLGYYLASLDTYGAAGYWIGLIIGLAASALGLLLRLYIVQKRFRSVEGVV